MRCKLRKFSSKFRTTNDLQSYRGTLFTSSGSSQKFRSLASLLDTNFGAAAAKSFSLPIRELLLKKKVEPGNEKVSLKVYFGGVFFYH
jgi:hypothetical protein